MGIPKLKVRWDRLIINMGILLLVRWQLYIETAPCPWGSVSVSEREEGEFASSLKIIIYILRPVQNGKHFAHNILKCVFLNENINILIQILLELVHEDLVDNKSTLVQQMAWCWTVNKAINWTKMDDIIWRHGASMT